MRATILILGHCCVDALARLPHWPHPDEKVEAASMRLTGGGPAPNAAVALARLGHAVRFVGTVGDDDAGELALRWLAEEGVDVSACERIEGISTSLALAWATGERRSIAWRRGGAAPLSFDSDRVDELLDGVDLLYLDSHEILAGAQLAPRARRRGIGVLCDLGTLRPGLAELLPLLDVAVAAPRFARAFTGEEGARAALRALRASCRPEAWVGITLGAKGCFCATPGGEAVVPARRVEVVDTTGAGDAFHAGLADAWLLDLPAERAFEHASALAALACRELGGRAGLPRTREALDEAVRDLPRRTPADVGVALPT